MNKLLSSIIILLGTANIATATGHDQYNWAGVYAGLNLGSIWTNSHLTANHEFFISETATYSQNLNSTNVNPGFQFGYLQQLDNNWVVGGEADFSYPATSNTYTNQWSGDPGVWDRFNVRNNLQGSLRLRAGYTIDRFLPFITAGVSFASMGLYYDNEEQNSANAYSTSTTQTGWVLGGGLEYGVLDNLSVRTEYLYTDYGNALNMNMPNVAGIPDPNGAAHVNMSTNVLRAAVNYRF
ncbi:MAG: outer membrane protein [Methylococcaceae bacterium]